jgi:hypothetical protein
VVLSDGTRRYAILVRIGNVQIEAGLDTGSTGLRVLPGAVGTDDAQVTAQKDSYSFGAGAKLNGVVGRATISIGELSGRSSLQLVQSVACSDAVPQCAAASVPITQYGIQGNGLPGEGFKAIMGVNMADADVASLFREIGARRWIIDLPRPGSQEPGRIVFNPPDTEIEGFVNLPIIQRFADLRGGGHDAINGCLINEVSHEKLCGAIILDTGAPGITIARPDKGGQPWSNGTPATLLFADDSGGIRAAERLIIGRRDHASRLTFERRPQVPMTMIFTGLTPYLAYSVLYDPQRRTVGLRPRIKGPDGPEAVRGN